MPCRAPTPDQQNPATQGSNPRLADPAKPALRTLEPCLGQASFDIPFSNPNPYQASFEILFPRLLKPGGVYIIEDVHWWGAVCMVI